ncbi:MAG: hypothetical protein WCE98_10945, partial [Chlorobium sp.]
AQPPLKIFVGGNKFSGDWRPTILAGIILVAYFVIIQVDPLRKIFNLEILNLVDYMILAACRRKRERGGNMPLIGAKKRLFCSNFLPISGLL